MRSLDTFILDEMIEQYRRLNPPPDPTAERPGVREMMEAELLASLLEELKALRVRCSLYESRIVQLNREKSELDNQLREKK